MASRPSRCAIDIERSGTAINLSITHSIERDASTLIAAVSGGWPKVISNLKSLLETGRHRSRRAVSGGGFAIGAVAAEGGSNEQETTDMCPICLTMAAAAAVKATSAATVTTVGAAKVRAALLRHSSEAGSGHATVADREVTQQQETSR